MEERTLDILEAAIADFIETGEPISSSWLFAHHKFGIRPAMIRWELSALEEAGYLEQPYHSAGRLPTSRGYEFFARRAFTREGHSHGRGRVEELFLEGAWESLAHEVSRALEALGIVQTLPQEAMFTDGLAELIANLESNARGDIRQVIEDFEELGKRLAASEALEGRSRDGEDGVNVYVGRRNPVTRSPQLAVMWETYPTGSRGGMCLYVVGPRRMDYARAADMFRQLEAASREME